jgi:hypothetical protein
LLTIYVEYINITQPFGSLYTYIFPSLITMAPAATSSIPTAPHDLAGPISRDIFPDGLKTTGQHPPLYDHIIPFEKFPKQITGPTVWKAEEYRENPEKWTHVFTQDQIDELSSASDAFLSSKTPLTGISKVRTMQVILGKL